MLVGAGSGSAGGAGAEGTKSTVSSVGVCNEGAGITVGAGVGAPIACEHCKAKPDGPGGEDAGRIAGASNIGSRRIRPSQSLLSNPGRGLGDKAPRGP